MSRLWIASLVLLPLLSCGGPVDQFWKGPYGDCTTGGVTQAPYNDYHSLIVLEGPITALPKGMLGYEDKFGNRILIPFTKATYFGPTLKFTIEQNGDNATNTTEGEFTRGPTTLKGQVTSRSSTPGTSETTCKMTLTADR